VQRSKSFITVLLVCSLLSGCVVMPTTDTNKQYKCSLSSDKKTLKVVNLIDGSANFYQWQDEILAPVTLPVSLLLSGTYVIVNNIYHIGEEIIKC
jgi:hypothetical protein